MERWRYFAAGTVLSIVFLVCLVLIAEFGRARLRTASENLQATMSRRVVVGELRERMAEAALGCRSYLLTGDPAHLATVRTAGRAVNETADRLIAGYRGEDARVADPARRLRYLAGMQLGEMNTVIAAREESGAASAVALVGVQDSQFHTQQRFQALAHAIEQYERARMQEDQARWREELTRVRNLTLAGMIANILLVASAALMAAAMDRRHGRATQQLTQRRDELEQEAITRASELNSVYGQLQSVQEQERSQLARGLHDELGGLLLAARMDVTWLQQHGAHTDARTARQRLARVLEVLDQGIDLKRRVVEELRPTLLDNMGFIAAVRWQMEETCGRGGLRCEGHFPDGEPPLNPRAAIALFRVAQEALLNAQKHAKAQAVQLTLRVTPTHVVLSIRDDGQGIGDTDAQKMRYHGLAGMKHRIGGLGGTLFIGVHPEGGTEVRAAVPVENALLDSGTEPGGFGARRG